MVMTKAIAKLITSDQTHQIPSQLQMGSEFGMQLFDQALLQALNAREIDPDDAYVYATDKRLFQKFVTDTSMMPRARRHRNPAALRAERCRSWHRSTNSSRKSCSGAARICTSWPAIRRASVCTASSRRCAGRRSRPNSSRKPCTKSCRARRSSASSSKDGADFAYTLEGKGRFRVNVMRQLNGMGAVLRAIPSQALTLDQLDMPTGRAPALPREQVA